MFSLTLTQSGPPHWSLFPDEICVPVCTNLLVFYGNKDRNNKKNSTEFRYIYFKKANVFYTKSRRKLFI